MCLLLVEYQHNGVTWEVREPIHTCLGKCDNKMYFTPKKAKMHLESLSVCYELASCLSFSSLAKHLLHQRAESNWF